MHRPFRTIFSQVFALVLTGIIATLALGLSVLAFSPPPPPPTVSVATYVDAFRTGSEEHLSSTTSGSPPKFWSRSQGQAEILIGASLASGVGLKPTDIRVVITAPAMFGLLPRSGTAERGQMTIIDVPASLRIGRTGSALDMNRYLRNGAVRVPPFVAVIQLADGSFLQLQPRERLPTAWQLRLLTIFALSLLAVTPLAWFGARQWTDSIRRLAAHVERFDVHVPSPPVATARDPEEVKALEHAFESLHERLRAQLDERMQMLMAVAHDLRTPLTSLRIRSEDVDESLRSGFIRDLARLEQMIEGILAFARAQNPQRKVEVVDFCRLVVDLVSDARAQGDRIELEAQPASVRGNPVDLSRAVDNLLSNARRYSTGAAVTVTTSGGCAVLRVVDNGPGVPEELISRLTQPFFRIEGSRSAETGGIGLGLSTVEAIVDSHNGSLTFENMEAGFKVEITLPSFAAG